MTNLHKIQIFGGCKGSEVKSSAHEIWKQINTQNHNNIYVIEVVWSSMTMYDLNVWFPALFAAIRKSTRKAKKVPLMHISSRVTCVPRLQFRIRQFQKSSQINDDTQKHMVTIQPAWIGSLRIGRHAAEWLHSCFWHVASADCSRASSRNPTPFSACSVSCTVSGFYGLTVWSFSDGHSLLQG